MSNFTRRQFMATTIATGAAAAASAVPLNPEEKQTVVHHVFFWLVEPSNLAHAKQLQEGLKTLASIPQVKKLLIGEPASTEKREVVDNSWQVSELMYFNSIDDQAAYQEHPMHKAFVNKYSHLWKKVVVYDMVTT